LKAFFRIHDQTSSTMKDRRLTIIASTGLAIGGVFGIAGTLAPTAALRGLAWGLDGVALIVASALLTVRFFRLGQDFVAAGFLVFAVGEGLVVSCSAMDLTASVPVFGAGVATWSAALALISLPNYFPTIVRLLGILAALLFAATAAQILGGVPLLPTTKPLPFFAYPGWIWTLLRRENSAA
jgi:hypothetical protein